MAIRASITTHGPSKHCVVAPSDAPECLWVASRLLSHHLAKETKVDADFGVLVDGVLTEMEHADGIVRFAVLAQPWHHRYFTLSVWRDEQALAAWKESPNHVRAMNSAYAPGGGGPPGFLRWHAPDGEIRWGDVIHRFEASDRTSAGVG